MSDRTTSLQEARTSWLCVDCIHMLVNAESLPDRPADAPEPMGLLADTRLVSPGRALSEHDDDCAWQADYRGLDCTCGADVDDFSSRPCDGCGDHLAGERHAVTVWEA